MFSKTIFYRTHTKRILYQIGYLWGFTPGYSSWGFPETGTYSFLIVCQGGLGGNSFPSGWGYGGLHSIHSPIGWTNLTITTLPSIVNSIAIQMGSSTYYSPGVQLNCTQLGLLTNFQGGRHGDPPADSVSGGWPNGGGQNQSGTSGSAPDLTTVNSRFMNRFVAGVPGAGGERNGVFGGGGGGDAGINVLPGLGFPTGYYPTGGAAGESGVYAGKGGTGYGAGGGGAGGDYGGDARGGSPGGGQVFVIKVAN